VSTVAQSFCKDNGKITVSIATLKYVLLCWAQGLSVVGEDQKTLRGRVTVARDSAQSFGSGPQSAF
jgi:hypothetical protein